jgi:hypothetical protein
MLATDWAPPTSSVLTRLSDARARQYWDRGHILAKRLASDARAPQPTQSCCLKNDVLWDLAAVYPAGPRWDGSMPPASFFDGPVVDVISSIESALAANR